jgi:hypothetical protein
MLCAPQAVPPSTQYIARLAKQLITAAEEEQQELSEPLLELHTALLMLGSSAAAVQVSVCPLEQLGAGTQ